MSDDEREEKELDLTSPDVVTKYKLLLTGRKADVIAAASTAAEVALRLVRPGKSLTCSGVFQGFMIFPSLHDSQCRALEAKRARLGIVEFVNHDLLQSYPVLHEKSGDFVAHLKFTVLLMPNGSNRVNSHSLQELQPTKATEDPEINSWLALGVKSKKKGGGKKKKKANKSAEGHG